MEKLDILKQFKFFRDSSPAFQKELLAAATPVVLPAGSLYVHEGDECRRLAIVGAGSLQVFKVADSGREMTLYHVQAGEICLLNMSCLMAGAPCPASARVEAEVHALVFDADEVRRWMNSQEALRNYAFELVATHFALIMTLIEEVAFRNMDRRLADYLSTRFADLQQSPPSIEITHAQIAAELGSAREVVSRLLKDFENRGAVQLSRGRISLANKKLLKSISSA